MLKCSVFIAISLDGYIARPDGAIDWLERPEYAPAPGEDAGYEKFIETVDYLIMGRHSFEKVLTFPEWSYPTLQVVVLSSREVAIPPELDSKVSSMNAAPEELTWTLAAVGAKHLYIDGGVTIQRFLQAGLIDEMTITIIPVLLGEGLPLFGPLKNDLHLKLLHSHYLSNGMVQNKYAVIHPD